MDGEGEHVTTIIILGRRVLMKLYSNGECVLIKMVLCKSVTILSSSILIVEYHIM